MDLDYRALGNAGLWCLGRLQTDADRERVLDGLANEAQVGGSAEELAETLKRLGPRWFVVRRVAETLARVDGLDACHIRDRGLLGATDAEVLERAFAEELAGQLEEAVPTQHPSGGSTARGAPRSVELLGEVDAERHPVVVLAHGATAAAEPRVGDEPGTLETGPDLITSVEQDAFLVAVEGAVGDDGTIYRLPLSGFAEHNTTFV